MLLINCKQINLIKDIGFTLVIYKALTYTYIQFRWGEKGRVCLFGSVHRSEERRLCSEGGNAIPRESM